MASPQDLPDPRKLLGRMVRQIWVAWAREQSDPKPSWLAPWEGLDEGQREVDMRMGDVLFATGVRAGQADAKTELEEYRCRFGSLQGFVEEGSS